MSKIQVTHEDIKRHPELAEFEGQTIDAKDYNKAIGLSKVNVAPQPEEKAKEEKEVEAPKKKATSKKKSAKKSK